MNTSGIRQAQLVPASFFLGHLFLGQPPPFCGQSSFLGKSQSLLILPPIFRSSHAKILKDTAVLDYSLQALCSSLERNNGQLTGSFSLGLLFIATYDKTDFWKYQVFHGTQVLAMLSVNYSRTTPHDGASTYPSKVEATPENHQN
jgi:hypothetical protein